MIDNVYTFFGSDRKNGTTMVAQSVAQTIATTRPDISILLISLNGRRNAQYMREEVKTIDDFKTQIDSGIVISKQDLMQSRVRENFYIINGLKNETEERFYMPETAQRVLGILAPLFHLVIVDAGNEIDNGLAVGGLKAAKMRYMVLCQNEAAIRRFEKNTNFYEAVNIGFDSILLNKFMHEDPYTVEYIGERLKITCGRVLPVHFSEHYRDAERARRTLLDYRYKDYGRDITKIAGAICKDVGIGDLEGHKKLGWKCLRRA